MQIDDPGVPDWWDMLKPEPTIEAYRKFARLRSDAVNYPTNLIEHPRLVCHRILRYAAIVGREDVIAGTDCGLGGRVHADLAWAKLRTLVDGARLASTSLWP